MTKMYDAPIHTPLKTVQQDWIDYNGHMNMAYYVLLFDQSLDYVYDLLEIGESYVREQNGSCFTREIQVNYLRELSLGDRVVVEFQLLDWDAKRLHFFQTMRHGDEGYVAATSEQLALHVDMTSRRTAPFPNAVQQRLTTLMHTHGELAKPAQAGHEIGIPKTLA